MQRNDAPQEELELIDRRKDEEAVDIHEPESAANSDSEDEDNHQKAELQRILAGMKAAVSGEPKIEMENFTAIDLEGPAFLTFRQMIEASLAIKHEPIQSDLEAANISTVDSVKATPFKQKPNSYEVILGSLRQTLQEGDEYDHKRTCAVPGWGGATYFTILTMVVSGSAWMFARQPKYFIDFAQMYFDANTTNGEKCGLRYPLSNLCTTISSPSFQYPAWYCGDLARRLCENVDSLDIYNTYIFPRMNASCAESFDLNDFSRWRSIMGAAWNCYLKAEKMCNRDSTNLYKYLHTTVVQAGRNITCGEALPLGHLCDADSFVITPKYRCAMVAKQIYETVTPLVIEFNSTNTNSNSSCNNLYPDFLNNYGKEGPSCNWNSVFGNGIDCFNKASDFCGKDPHKHFWTRNRLIAFVAGIAAAMLLAMLAIIVIRRMCKQPKKYRTFHDLQEPLKGKLERAAGKNDLTFLPDEPVSSVVEKVEKIIPQRKQEELQRVTFFGAQAKANENAPLHTLLVNDVGGTMQQGIMEHAGLWRPGLAGLPTVRNVKA